MKMAGFSSTLSTELVKDPSALRCTDEGALFDHYQCRSVVSTRDSRGHMAELREIIIIFPGM